MENEYIEVTGKTVDDCITEACQKLSVISSRLDYQVISEGSSGFLGFNVKPAKIRARIRQNAEEIPEDSRESQKETKGPQDSTDKKPSSDIFSGNTGEKKEENSEPDVNGSDSEDKQTNTDSSEEYVSPIRWDRSSPSEDADQEEERENTGRTERSGRYRQDRSRRREYGNGRDYSGHGSSRRGGRGDFSYDRRSRQIPEADSAADSSAITEVHEETREKIPEEKQLSEDQISEVKARAEKFLTDVFHDMKMEVQISVNFEKEWNSLDIDLAGEDMGVLIGKRGQTLDSLQYLVSLVVNRGMDSYIHVKADTENYRARRKETLEILARNIASKVRRTRRPVELEPMNPYERRIIHSALQSDRYVTTYSEGEEPYRRVVVAPRRPGQNQN